MTHGDDRVGDGSRVSPDAVAVVARAFRARRGSVAVAVIAVVVVAVISITTGAAGLNVGGVVTSLIDHLPFIDVDSSLSSREDAILTQIRLPRLVLGMLVGGSLSMSGAAYQGVFRNPLADPYLLGVSAGAGCGAVLAIGFGVDLGWGPIGAVPAAAFIGALAAVGAATAVSRGSWSSPATLLLAGVAMAALFSAVQTYALQRLSASRAREVLSWLFGQLNTSGWAEIGVLAPYAGVCAVALMSQRRHLDVLRLGDDEARSVGLDPVRVRVRVVAIASLMTAAAVSVSGLIAFVGLVVPHVVRILVGSSYRIVLPMSALVGAAFLAFVDVGARTVAAPVEMPVGVITAFVGAPFFAIILWRRHAVNP